MFGSVPTFSASGLPDGVLQASSRRRSCEIHDYKAPNGVYAHAEAGKVTTEEVEISMIVEDVDDAPLPTAGSFTSLKLISTKITMSNEDFPTVAMTFQAIS